MLTPGIDRLLTRLPGHLGIRWVRSGKSRRVCLWLLCLALTWSSVTLGALPTLTVGTNVNITKSTANNAEETIAINPKNPLNLFASETASLATKYSLDGGLTWNNCNVTALGASIGDVAGAFDDYSNLFLVELSSSSFHVVVGLSTNGGATFSLLYQTASSGNDQPSVTVGPSSTSGQGSVWITYTDNTGSGRINAQGAAVTGLGHVGTFSAAQIAPGTSGANGGDYGDIVVGPSGQVMVTYQSVNGSEGPDDIWINLDADGLGAGGFGTQSIATATHVGSFSTIPAQPKRKIDAEAGLAWDRSSGPYHGRLYLLYTDRPSTNSPDTDIYVRYSTNNGTNWSSPVRVNDDPIGNGKSQFLPKMALDQTSGFIAVSFYDCRNSAGNNTTEVWATVSTNGGVSFLPNVKVSAGVSSALVSAIAGTSFDYGDYTGLTFYGGVFYPCWADNSNSTGNNPSGALSNFDMYTARVTVNLPVVMVNPRRSGKNFLVSVQTTVGKTYYLQSAPSLTNPFWTTGTNVVGNGLLQDLVDTNLATQKFYRVLAQ